MVIEKEKKENRAGKKTKLPSQHYIVAAPMRVCEATYCTRTQNFPMRLCAHTIA